MARGFPSQDCTKEVIIDILKNHGGSVRIQKLRSGLNIYDELASRLGVSSAARQRLTTTGEHAWRPEVGYCKKELVRDGLIQPASVSGRGVWTLRAK